MKTFSEFFESVKELFLKSNDLVDYLNKFKKYLSAPLRQLINLTADYNILNKTSFEYFIGASKSDIDLLSKRFSIPVKDTEKMIDLIKVSKSEIKLMPQEMSKGVFDAMMRGKLKTFDILLDLKTTKGRNAAAKQFMPFVYKKVQEFVGKSNLSKTDLLSVALEGLTKAMNEWSVEPDKNGKVVSFMTMAAFRISQEIIQEIARNGYTLSGSTYYKDKKYGGSTFDAKTLSSYLGKDGDEYDQSKLGFLGMTDTASYEEKDTQMKEFFKLLEKNFPERACNVFYRYYGLNGYKREKSKDIAKSIGMSEGSIRNSFINKILKWAKSNKTARNVLADLQDMYTEALMCTLYSFDRNYIVEYLINDDTYILLEELVPWRSNASFVKSHKYAIKYLDSKDVKRLVGLLSGSFLNIDDNLKKENKLIKKYVSLMYPKVNVDSLSDISLLDKMEELQTAYQKAVDNLKKKKEI